MLTAAEMKVLGWWDISSGTMPSRRRLPLFAMIAIFLKFIFQGPFVAGLSSGDSITAVFAERAENCYSSRGHGLEGANCGETFTMGASYAIRLLSDPPTKEGSFCGGSQFEACL